jgi:hypothetical protein
MTRQEIRYLFDRAEALRDYPGSYFPALNRARKALAEWRAQHPREAAMETAANLRAQADDLERKAQGALTYDADGWLSAADRQRRHDEWMTEAEENRSQAARIEELEAAMEAGKEAYREAAKKEPKP